MPTKPDNTKVPYATFSAFFIICLAAITAMTENSVPWLFYVTVPIIFLLAVLTGVLLSNQLGWGRKK